jgi:hypothetical protein
MFENDHLHVVEYRLKATDRVDPRLDGACLLMPLTATNLRINGGDSRVFREHEIYWSDSGIDTVEADGGAEAWILVAQFKGTGPSGASVVAEDNAMILEPSIYRLVFENHRARVAWVTTRPGDKAGMHSHPARVFRYPVAPNVLRTIAPDGTSRDLATVAGTAFWREEPSMHTFENIGDTEGQLVLIEVR